MPLRVAASAQRWKWVTESTALSEQDARRRAAASLPAAPRADPRLGMPGWEARGAGGSVLRPQGSCCRPLPLRTKAAALSSSQLAGTFILVERGGVYA